jgi:hypothetical protein
MSENTPALTAAAPQAAAPASRAADQAAVGRAFETLGAYDHGSSRASLMPLDEAVVASLGDAAARKDLEQRLAGVLSRKVSPVAKQYVCAKLRLIGSAESVPALAGLLADRDLAHAARGALESMPCPEALQSLRDALPKLSGLQKVGLINSLAVRRDTESVPALVALLKDPDAQVAAAAAAALDHIGTPEDD